MCRNKLYFLYILYVLTFSISCNSENNQPISTQNAYIEKNTLAVEYLGNYQGVQPAYNLKNQEGEDLIINGNVVSIPEVEYVFQILEGNEIRMKQTNLETKETQLYTGTYDIESDGTDMIVLQISVSDGEYSSPSYTLEINKLEKSGNCIGSRQPAFALEKTD